MTSEDNKSPKRKNAYYPDNFNLDFTPLRDLMERMDSLFNRSFKHMNSHLNLNNFWVNTYETDTNVLVEAELPGYRKEQVKLEIIGNRLRIYAEDNNMEEITTDSFQSRKQMVQRKERYVTLPFEIPEKETTASFQNGLLKVTIPKKNSKRKYIDIDE